MREIGHLDFTSHLSFGCNPPIKQSKSNTSSIPYTLAAKSLKTSKLLATELDCFNLNNSSWGFSN